MKYISVVVVLILMSWTWCLATGNRPMRLEEHRRVEAGVEEDVREFIKKRYADANEIFCNRLYTEVTQPGTDLIAHFRCQAISAAGEEQTEQVFEGFLRLKSQDGFQTWAETGGEINAREVNFLHGVKITPQAAEEEKK